MQPDHCSFPTSAHFQKRELKPKVVKVSCKITHLVKNKNGDHTYLLLTLQTLSLQSFANSFSEAAKHSYQEHCPGNPDLLFLSCGPEKVYQMHYAPDVLCEVMNTAGFLRSWGEREELLHMGSMTPDAPQAFEICCYDRYSLHFGAEPQAIQSTFPESYRI